MKTEDKAIIALILQSSAGLSPESAVACVNAVEAFAEKSPEDRRRVLDAQARAMAEVGRGERQAEPSGATCAAHAFRNMPEFKIEPNWIDRASWIARQMREPAREALGDIVEARDPEGLSGHHLLWMLEELSARRVGSETKTCRWLGYAQALAGQFGITSLEQAKQLNLRSKTEAPLVETPKADPGPAPTQNMRAALQGLLDMYIDGVKSGDWGNWDPEKQPEVIAARAALNAFPARTPEPDFQAQCQKWLEEVVHDDPTDLAERRARFLEEALELVQSLDMTLNEVIQVAAYVFGRPAGEPAQEYGGMLTTAMVLAQYTGHDLMGCGQAELERCWDPAVIEKIRGKRSRRHGRGPLPGTEADLVPANPRPEHDEP